MDAARVIAEFADEQTDVADAFVTLCVHSGIASADVICCVRLGHYSVGEDHQQAVALLRTADRGAASHLSRLMGMKSKAEYLHKSVSSTECKAAGRAAERLLEIALGSAP